MHDRTIVTENWPTQDNRPAQNGSESAHDVDDIATSPTCHTPVENAQPKAAENREAERSNRVCALMEGRCHEQVPTASSTTEGLSKKQTPLGKREDRPTWTQLYGR